MKKFKILLIMTLCFAFVLTTNIVTPNYDVNYVLKRYASDDNLKNEY